MKRITTTLTFICIALVSISQITLSGSIVDTETKSLLHKAILTINDTDHTVITDQNGSFSIELRNSGTYKIDASKADYKTATKNIILTENRKIIIMMSSTTSAYESIVTNIGTVEKPKILEQVKPNTSRSKTTPIESQIATIIGTDVTNGTAIEKAISNNKTETIKLENSTVEKNNNTETIVIGKTISNEKDIVKAETKAVEKKLISISGTLRDQITKETLGESAIKLKGVKKMFDTSADGEFFIQVEAKDYYFITASKFGYENQVDSLPALEDINLNIYLTKTQVDSFSMMFTADDVVISRTRATENTPTTFRKIEKEEIAENNLGKDLPFLLELTPSVVATSDGGSGTGYTSMRIRGSDITRINFTINGFPVNDAESQGVFLVNTPDLASSIEDIQIQRGVGTSTNGAGAFGASVNINTNKLNKKAYAEFNNAFGSFNTFKNTVKLGTGELFNHFSFDGRFSHIYTDGYIDRAQAKMFAYALTGTYFNKKSMIRFNIFNGHERTYQAWNGIDYRTMQTNRRFNSAGTDFGQLAEPYQDEVDNYNQENYQLSLSHKFDKHFSANLGFHYTRGKGYFEQYRVGQDLANYGAPLATNTTDLIYRRWLDNDFFGTIFSLNYKKKKIDATLGGGWNQYSGDHFGEIIWTKEAQNLRKDQVFYFNNGLKTDFNTFLKAEYNPFKRLVLFGDIQYRRVSYSADGIDFNQQNIFEDVDYNFFNPKAGLTVLLGKKMKSQLYTSFAMANREPTRNDFIDNDNEPKPENLINLELGFRHANKKMSYSVNAFYMKYKNQLVLTGELNDVGLALRANVDNSFRTGLELDFDYEPTKYIGFRAAGAWSLNEIESFTFTNYLGNQETHDKTKIAYAPSLVGNFTIYSKPFKGFEIALINKYVSEQFLDNTNSKSKILNPYFLNDARISYEIKPKFMQAVEFVFKVNNILNVKYASNGYVFFDTPYFYPQAGINFEGAINLKF